MILMEIGQNSETLEMFLWNIKIKRHWEFLQNHLVEQLITNNIYDAFKFLGFSDVQFNFKQPADWKSNGEAVHSK